MAKLYFRYGAMGSSKTANALMVCYNYEERNQKVLLAKSAVDTRDGVYVVRSRAGLERECILLDELCNKMTPEEIKEYSAIVIDEAQFATEAEIDYLTYIVDELDVPVICYGLRTDFQNKLFPGSERLFAVADVIEEIKTICWCGAAAKCNARYNKNGIVREGAQVMLGANDSYIALCRKHFKEGNFGPNWNGNE